MNVGPHRRQRFRWEMSVEFKYGNEFARGIGVAMATTKFLARTESSDLTRRSITDGPTHCHTDERIVRRTFTFSPERLLAD